MSLTLTLSRGGGTMTGYGTDITLNGTGDGQLLSVDLYGDTQQQTYSGKNYYDVYDTASVTSGITVDNDGWISISSDNQGSSTMFLNYFTNELDIQTSTQYDVFLEVKNVSGGGDLVVVSLHSSAQFTSQTSVALSSLQNNTVYKYTKTSKSDFSDVTRSLRTYLSLGSGLACSITFRLSVLDHSDLAPEDFVYEPYTGLIPSPNPDYPQDVQVVKGLQTVTISDGGSQTQTYQIDLEGKNKFSTVIEQGSIDSVTGDISNNKRARSKGFVDVLPNTEYTFNLTNNLGSPSLGIAFAYDKNGNYVTQYPSSGWSSMPLTFTTGATIEKIRVVLKTQNEAVVSGSNFSDVQLELGGSATAYVDYRAIELYKIGDYQDYIYKDSGSWYVHRECDKAIFTSTDTFTAGSYGSYYYFGCSRPTDATNKPCYANHFRYGTLLEDKDNSVYVSTTGVVFYRVTVGGSYLTTEAAFTSWLAKKTAVVYYVLANDRDYQITDSGLVSQLEALAGGYSYSGTTVITVNGDLKSPLEVSASTAVTKTYTEAELGVPLTIADVEGKSQTTTLDGNIFVDWAYNKKQLSVDLFNLTPIDYAEIRSFYEYQFLSSEFPTITIPELNITDMPVFMEMSSRNIVNKCLLTDKITLKFRETIQP